MINWTIESISGWLSDKQQTRTIHPSEYICLIEHIFKTKPSTIIDIGTYLGTSGYILGTCCDSIKKVYSIDNINSPGYTEKLEATREDHGKYLPENCIFLKNGYEQDLTKELIGNPNETFLFWDAGKNFVKVLNQIKLSFDFNVRYIALHDSNVMTVRRAIDRANKLKWYKTISEDYNSCPEKGVTILEKYE